MSKFKNIKQITRFLDDTTNYEKELPRYTTRNYNLKSMSKIMKRLGSPHLKFKSIHVAGSTGKGSVCKLLDSIYAKNGYRTGCYTSPHLTDIRERIALDNNPCPAKLFINSFNRIFKSIRNNGFTFFEILTALAFYIFCKSRVDIAIIETGLGGRLDCTNIIKPEVSVLTRIEKEHRSILGNKIEDIVSEKCGIIKDRVPVVAYDSGTRVTRMIKSYCSRRKSRLVLVPPFVQSAVPVQGVEQIMYNSLNKLAVNTTSVSLGHLTSALIAIKTIEQIKQQFPVNLRSIPAIIEKSKIEGRYHIISNDPLVIADNAHTVQSIRLLYKTLEAKGKRDVITIFSLLKDKEIKGITKTICMNSRRVFYTKIPSKRAYLPSKNSFISYGKMIRVTSTLDEAMIQAIKSLKNGSIVLITGSTYLIADAIKKFRGSPPRITLT